MENKIEQYRSSRYTGIDILRIISTIFVFIIHLRMNIHPDTSYNEFIRLYGSPIQRFVVFFLYNLIHIAVPMFLIVSGFCNYKNEEISVKSYIKKIVKNYLPYIIACVVYLIIYAIVGEINNITGILQWGKKVINFSHPYMWYMGCYLVLLLLMPYINKMIKMLSNKELLMLIGILIIVVLLPTTVNVYEKGLLNEYYVQGLDIILYYIIGVFFRRNIDKINARNIKKIIIMPIIINILAFVLLPIADVKNINTTGLIAVTISIAIFMIVFYYGNKLKESKVISKISSLTLYMYMIGWNYERLVYRYIGAKVFVNNMLYCILFIIGEIFITIVVSLLLKKILDKVSKEILQLLKIEKKDTDILKENT